ncbi:NYN domain-containing protein [Candidatus Merdisoma sp. HCP28S3_D10]|uniref:NYN domain-containing protein n=1 Tax=unclassified Candidatus Merdisoma TaxID=3099611 RepID=UPI003F8A8B00
MEQIEDKKQFAVLIDSDNISAKYAGSIFNEIENYGYASFRRIYGNWSGKSNGWKEQVLLENSITPVQQFSYTIGKNSTDMAMVIDAMDILYSGKVDGFCLVTSDSDFTRLAMRLREENMYVIGMGESKTPMALTKACNKFIHLNLINKQVGDTETMSATSGQKKSGKISAEEEHGSAVTPLIQIEDAIISIINDNENKGKATYLGELGSRLNDRFTDFDVRNYGYTKLMVFLQDTCPRLSLYQQDSAWAVGLHEQLDREKLEREIQVFIQKNGGQVDNLSLIYEEIHKKHSSFDIKDYGYSRLSSFLRSIRSLSVSGNTVSLWEKK